MRTSTTRTLLVLTLLLLLGGGAATAGHAQATRVSLSFEPRKDRYAREEVITIVATVRWAHNGQRVGAGMPVLLLDWSDHRPLGDSLGTVYTDGAGQARRRYRIPTDPREDNVFIGAWMQGWYWNGWEWVYYEAWDELRIPIGR